MVMEVMSVASLATEMMRFEDLRKHADMPLKGDSSRSWSGHAKICFKKTS